MVNKYCNTNINTNFKENLHKSFCSAENTSDTIFKKVETLYYYSLWSLLSEYYKLWLEKDKNNKDGNKLSFWQLWEKLSVDDCKSEKIIKEWIFVEEFEEIKCKYSDKIDINKKNFLICIDNKEIREEIKNLLLKKINKLVKLALDYFTDLDFWNLDNNIFEKISENKKTIKNVWTFVVLLSKLSWVKIPMNFSCQTTI